MTDTPQSPPAPRLPCAETKSCEDSLLSLKQEEEGIIEGYAATFQVDKVGDIIRRGAFAETIKAGDQMFLYQHNPSNVIGVIETLEEDNRGLKIRARIARGVQAADEAYNLAQMGAIKAFSIGFRPLDADIPTRSEASRGARRALKTVDLREVSLVSFPVNPRASVSSVKAETHSLVGFGEPIIKSIQEATRSVLAARGQTGEVK